MKRIRFSLRLLILLLTATGLILGAYQWKVVSAQREVTALVRMGVSFSMERDLFGVPVYADIPYASAQWTEIIERLISLGVDSDNIGVTPSGWQAPFKRPSE